MPDKDNEQLNLSFSHTETSLGRYLEKNLGKPVSLVLTDNAATMLSARAGPGAVHVRLHRMFLNADGGVMDEIISFLRNRRGRMPLFQGFIKRNREQLPEKPPRNITVRTAGRMYDLRELYDEINEKYFQGTVSAAITWGAGSPRRSVRKRTLGSYSARSHTIRINPVLDKKSVPRHYIAFVVYHEMLHAALGISRKGARRSVHSREFRKRERLFKDYERAIAWERGKA